MVGEGSEQMPFSELRASAEVFVQTAGATRFISGKGRELLVASPEDPMDSSTPAYFSLES